MELTEVPPWISPILKLVRGDSGTRAATNRAIPRPSAWMGLGRQKPDQLWPPGPVIETSTRRDASAAVVTYSVAEPSRAITYFRCFLYASTSALIPRRFPSPSSPTSATNKIVFLVLIFASRNALDRASSAASPVPLFEIPG